MKKQKRQILFTSIFTLILTVILGGGPVFAWFPNFFSIFDFGHNPGSIDHNGNFSYWDKNSTNTNKWVTNSSENPVTFYLGEMSQIDVLPEDTKNYLRFSFSENADIEYVYQVILEEINIIVDTTLGIVVFEDIGYYSAEPSQKVFDYYFFESTNATLNPVSNFEILELLEHRQVTTLNQNLTGDFQEKSIYLYVMFDIRLIELQNIIDRIPINYSPYSLEFSFAFMIEKRTTDA